MGPRAIRQMLIFLCLAALVVIYGFVVRATGGLFVYTLDDPYIHLALAKQISLGHYGINAAEPAAPASSLLWPLLLALFANVPHADLVPLVINSACLLGTASLLMRFFERHCGAWQAAVLTLSVVWGLNLLGLVFTGMEHSLQVLLVTLVVVWIGGVAVPSPLVFASLVLLPWVRYEDLAISLPVLAWHGGLGSRQRRVTGIALTCGVLVMFSVFLHSNGVGWLPSSILAKQRVVSGLGGHRLNLFYLTLRGNLQSMGLYAAAILALALWAYRRRRLPLEVALLTLVAVPTFLFGDHGWFGRYQVHFLIFATVIIATVTFPLISRGTLDKYSTLLAAGFILLNSNLWPETLRTPKASRDVAEQQLQMSEIVRYDLQEPVAVNDLGLMAYRSGHYVLDLWGLGSPESLKARYADPSGQWVPGVMTRHNVEFALIYTQWFPQASGGWIEVGELKLTGPAVTAAYANVALFATNPAAARRLRLALERYRDRSALGRRVLTLRPE